MSQVCRMLMQHLSPQIVICVHGRSIFDPRFQNVPLSLVRGGGPQANAKGSLPTNTLGTRSRHVLRLSQWERLLQPLLPFWWLRVMRIAFGILNDLFFSHFSAWIRTHHLRNPNPWYRLANKSGLQTKTIHYDICCFPTFASKSIFEPRDLNLHCRYSQFSHNFSTVQATAFPFGLGDFRTTEGIEGWDGTSPGVFSTGQGRLPGLRDAFSGLLWYL